MTETLLAPEQHWAIWFVLLAAAALGIWSERTRWGARLSGAVVTIFATFVLSNLGIIPAEAPAYGVVWSTFVPLAVPLLLLQADLRRIVRESGPTLVAFGLGAVGTVIGTVVAYRLVDLGPDGAKLASIFCATYIGGSINYAAAAEATGLQSGDLLTAGVAADNLVMTLYFLVLFALPSVAWLRSRYVRRVEVSSPGAKDQAEAAEGGGSTPARGGGSPQGHRDEPAAAPLNLHSMLAALALSAGFCAVGYALAPLLGFTGGGILIVTVLAVTTATVAPRAVARVAGAERVGMLFMQIFFAVIGASAHVGTVMRVGPVLFAFAALILATHLAFLLLAGRIVRLDLVELVIASNANMGGPTTAAAMASARGWTRLIVPAILCGTLGYAVATFIGVAVGRWLGG